MCCGEVWLLSNERGFGEVLLKKKKKKKKKKYLEICKLREVKIRCSGLWYKLGFIFFLWGCVAKWYAEAVSQ